MKTIPYTQQALYKNQSRFLESLDTALTIPVMQIQARIRRYPDAIPNSDRQALLVETGFIIQSFYASVSQRAGYDGVAPLSSYATLVNQSLSSTINDVAVAHARWMKKTLPAHLWRWLSTAQIPRSVQEAERKAVYEAGHFWVDPNGYKLSDRIWETSVRTRTALDRLLLEGLNTGTSPDVLARRVEQFLLPSRAPIRTKKPYGRDGSFDAMRLARSEISRAHNAASLTSAKNNPFVMGMDWKLSASHPRVDICDRLATIGMSGERLKPPYPIDEALVPVQDSHPQCICVDIPAVDPAAVDRIIADLNAKFESAALHPPITPAAGYTERGYSSTSFLNVIWSAMGAYTAFQVNRWLSPPRNERISIGDF